MNCGYCHEGCPGSVTIVNDVRVSDLSKLAEHVGDVGLTEPEWDVGDFSVELLLCCLARKVSEAVWYPLARGERKESFLLTCLVVSGSALLFPHSLCNHHRKSPDLKEKPSGKVYTKNLQEKSQRKIFRKNLQEYSRD